MADNKASFKGWRRVRACSAARPGVSVAEHQRDATASPVMTAQGGSLQPQTPAAVKIDHPDAAERKAATIMDFFFFFFFFYNPADESPFKGRRGPDPFAVEQPGMGGECEKPSHNRAN